MFLKKSLAMTRLMKSYLAILLGTLTFLVGCSRGFDDGLKKHPVTGSVRIDGQPTAGLIVRFSARNETKSGVNARFPVGVSDDKGIFRVSTNGKDDGAVAGDYDVTVVWPESNEPPLRDKLKGAYSTAEKSKLKVTVIAGKNELQPFELDLPKSTAEPPLRRAED